MKLKLGIAQLLVEGCEPYRNMARAEKLVKQAAASGCDLVLLPETIDFAWTHPAGLKEAHPIPGEFSHILCRYAQDNSIWVCAGLTEKDGQSHYNSAILIDDNGQIVGKHRKINLLEVEWPFYSVGQSLGVFPTPFGNFGLNICADNYMNSIDIGHVLARMGAQLILSPCAWTVEHNVTEMDDPYGDKWLKPLMTLSNTHDIIVACATSVGYIVGGPYTGKKMMGGSLVTGKNGIIAKGGYNELAGELITADLEIPPITEKGIQIGGRIYRA